MLYSRLKRVEFFRVTFVLLSVLIQPLKQLLFVFKKLFPRRDQSDSLVDWVQFCF